MQNNLMKTIAFSSWRIRKDYSISSMKPDIKAYLPADNDWIKWFIGFTEGDGAI